MSEPHDCGDAPTGDPVTDGGTESAPLSAVDTEILHLTPEERRERGVSPDDVREAFWTVVHHGDAEAKRLGAVTLPALSLDREVLDPDNRHPVDLQGAIVESLSAAHADVRVPLILDEATLGAVDLDEATLHEELSLEGATVTGPLSAFETVFDGNLECNDAVFEGEVHLDEADFADDVSFDGARFEDHVEARGAAFHGESNVLDDNTSFVDADFASTTDFRETTFAFADFSGASFGGGTSFEEATFGGDIVFADCTFEGDLDADDADFDSDADFSGVTVAGDAWFRGVHFAGGSRILDDDVTFADAVFEDEVDFTRAVFRYTTAAGAEFHGPATFQECRFQGDADFPRCEFAAVADFDEARFIEDADFSDVRFQGEALFRGAEFLGEANHIEDNATFAGATFVERVDFENATFTSGDFTGTRFGDTARFRGTVFRDRADFLAREIEPDAYVDFTDAAIHGGELAQPVDNWVRYDMTRASLGAVALVADDPEENRSLLDYFRFCNTSFDEFDGNEFDFSQHVDYLDRNSWQLHVFEENEADFDYAVALTPATIESTYLRAKNAASAAGNKKAAGEFRVKRQQFARRKNWAVTGDGSEAIGVRLRNGLRAGENYFLGATCGHGMRLLRIAAVFLAAPLVFGLLYAFGGPAFETSAGQLTSLGAAATPAGMATLYENIYFSYISYTTIGYGNIAPVGAIARVLAPMEAYLSAILAALVVYALVKRSEL